ncbi:MAG TPA: hypothetical protein VIJ94_17650, partial [Caulobacteraceae bacterium]
TLTFAAPGSSSFSYITQEGHYSCVNGWVNIWGHLVYTATLGTASGALIWNNPPYSLASTNDNSAMVVQFGGTWSALSSYYVMIPSSTSAFKFVQFNGSGGASSVTATNVTSGSSEVIVFAASYEVNGDAC